VHLKATRSGAQVEPVAKRYETDAEGLPVLDDANQMSERPTQPIQCVHDDSVNLPTANSLHQFIQRRSGFAAATHSTIDILDGCPASGLTVETQFLKLILRLLTDR
jgi:hypothetical protein